MRRILITMAMFLFLSVTVFASDSFEMSELSSEEIEDLNDIGVTLLDEEPEKERITCFDINENGSFAVGVGEGSVKRVVVYNSDGEYMYAFNFVSDGSFGIEYKGDTISVCYVRGSLCQEINSDGQTVSVKKILDTSDNNDYWSRILYDTEQVVDGKTYSLKGKKFLVFPEYAKVVVTDSEGNEEVLYEAVDNENGIECVVVPLTLVAFASVYVYGEYRKKQSETA